MIQFNSIQFNSIQFNSIQSSQFTVYIKNIIILICLKNSPQEVTTIRQQLYLEHLLRYVFVVGP